MCKKNIASILIVAFFWLTFSETLFALQNDNSISAQLKKARSDYYEGQFEQAQEIVMKLLKSGTLNSEQQFEALIILAEIRRAVNDEPGARKIIRRILEIKPDYNPTIEQEPPPFVLLVQEERRALKKNEKAFYQNKKFWFISGAATVGLFGIILLKNGNGGGQNNILPAPPDWPKE
ncbi:hypothetical protein ACX8XN_03680 [Calditrichota bacterium GD2]